MEISTKYEINQDVFYLERERVLEMCSTCQGKRKINVTNGIQNWNIKDIMWELFPYALMSHKQVIANSKQGSFSVEKIVIPSFSIQRHEDLLFLARLIEYVNVINQYA